MSHGIAVGMSTLILPHNRFEVLDAMAAHLKGEPFELYPDFPQGGIVDVEDYNDGKGTVLVRARLNTSDPKRIIVEELPYGTTSESLINSIEDAAKKGRLKISSINDFTAESVNIEINLARNTYSKDIVDALYAYTDCERRITTNPLVIKDNVPTIMGVSEILTFHADHLKVVLKAELELEEEKLLARCTTARWSGSSSKSGFTSGLKRKKRGRCPQGGSYRFEAVRQRTAARRYRR